MLRDLFPNKDELDDFDERDLQLQSALNLLNGFLDKKEAGQSINEYYRIHEDKLQKDLAKNQEKANSHYIQFTTKFNLNVNILNFLFKKTSIFSAKMIA